MDLFAPPSNSLVYEQWFCQQFKTTELLVYAHVKKIIFNLRTITKHGLQSGPKGLQSGAKGLQSRANFGITKWGSFLDYKVRQGLQSGAVHRRGCEQPMCKHSPTSPPSKNALVKLYLTIQKTISGNPA